MIIRDRHYFLGTIKEIADSLTELLLSADSIKDTAAFTDFDFAIVDDYDPRYSLTTIAENAVGWYGVKRIDSGFNSWNLDLCGDYYGGGSLSSCSFDTYLEREEVSGFFQKLLVGIIDKHGEDATEKTILICEKMEKKVN